MPATFIDERRPRRSSEPKPYKTVMFKVDAQPPEVRAVVHEYGWPFVDQLLRLGVRSATQMRHIARELHGGHGMGGELRLRPGPAEVEGIAIQMANAYGRRQPNAADMEAARRVAGYIFSKLHWGRCQCLR